MADAVARPRRYHVVVDVAGGAGALTCSRVEQMLRELPGQIGMQILSGPMVLEGAPHNPGVTGFVIIDFSHIAVHTFTGYDDVMIDVFSCKAYDREIVRSFVSRFLDVEVETSAVRTVSWG